MYRLSFHALALAALLLAINVVSAGEAEAKGPISVENAWSRATAEDVQVAVGYLTIRNNGDAPDRLVSASAIFAGQTEIHQTKMVDGVMQMRPVTDGVPIPAKGTVALEPNSYHLMFIRFKGPLKKGDAFLGTLTFEHAGNVEVTFHVEAMGATAPSTQRD